MCVRLGVGPGPGGIHTLDACVDQKVLLAWTVGFAHVSVVVVKGTYTHALPLSDQTQMQQHTGTTITTSSRFMLQAGMHKLTNALINMLPPPPFTIPRLQP